MEYRRKDRQIVSEKTHSDEKLTYDRKKQRRFIHVSNIQAKMDR